MILYFDSYITDKPLIKSLATNTQVFRKKALKYAMPSKLEIAKYTLGTYSQHDWSYVLVRYEIEGNNSTVNKDFEDYVRHLFPYANIINKRSDSIIEFRRSWEILSRLESNWIFLSSNNDHPWLWYDKDYINRVLNVGAKFSNSSNFVSIIYSHYSEYYNLLNKLSPFYIFFGGKAEKIYNDEDCFVIPRPKGDYNGIQILEKKLFKYWLVDNIIDKRVIRTEDVAQNKITDKHIMVIPKREMCVHFDGYGHTEGSFIHIDPQRVPPLFIPTGYFEKKIMLSKVENKSKDPKVIKVGSYEDKYSFAKSDGCDIKLGLEGLPTAWTNRILLKDFNEDEWSINERKKESNVRKNVYDLLPLIFTIKYMSAIKEKLFFLPRILINKIKQFLKNIN